jgi:hypothetical protein
MQRSFDEAHEKGEIPFDETFDPAAIISDGGGRQWPYWLSATAMACQSSKSANVGGGLVADCACKFVFALLE